ncbi:MAG TPA: SigE family RNA polymerase sigma factor [Pilimelia sp.]|nr:SigE family RNA polymerase sigma factor [Pilimelia sp.]
MTPEHEREYVEYVTARGAPLRRLAFLLCGDGHRADDIVQQTFVQLYVHWRRARTADHIDRYVRRMVLRAYLDERRRPWSRVRLFEAPPEPAPGPPAGDPDERAVLLAALAKVPPRQRAVVVLRFLYDLPVDEVAALLGCSPGTVKSQTAHGLTALRRLLGDGAPARAGRESAR